MAAQPRYITIKRVSQTRQGSESGPTAMDYRVQSLAPTTQEVPGLPATRQGNSKTGLVSGTKVGGS